MDFDKIIIEFLQKAPVLSGIDAEIVLRDLYEIEAGIYNHTNNIEKRPMSSVAFHECEENTNTSILYASIDQYAGLQIKETFGLSLIEYLELPNEILLKINKVCKDVLNKKSGIVNQIEKDLGKPL